MAEGRPRRARPAFGLVVVAGILFRGGREVLERVAIGAYGLIAVPALLLGGVAVVGLWRYGQVRRAQARGGEFTAEQVVAQVEASGIGEPAFEEDGTLLGASVLVVNQRPKVIEVVTEYAVFDRLGRAVGAVRQVDQSRLKQIVRFVSAFDQFFTHRFDVLDADGQVVLGLLRPRKIFYTRLHVSSADGVPLGTIRQQNLFWKIRFEVVAASGEVLGQLRAENVRAWDFKVYDRSDHVVATLYKSWEGWARATFTRADHFVVRVESVLPSPFRELTVATALAADLALKQDTRR